MPETCTVLVFFHCSAADWERRSLFSQRVLANLWGDIFYHSKQHGHFMLLLSCSAMNTETQKACMRSKEHCLTRDVCWMCCLQIDFQNSDEGEVLKVLEQHAAKELQEDLLESEMQSGLSQVRLVRFADVQSMSSDLLLLAMYVSKAAYAAARKRIAALSNTSACVFVFLHLCPCRITATKTRIPWWVSARHACKMSSRVEWKRGWGLVVHLTLWASLMPLA